MLLWLFYEMDKINISCENNKNIIFRHAIFFNKNNLKNGVLQIQN